MKLYEKILAGVVLLLFGLQLLPNFPGKASLFALAIWVLALSYLIGGYWLFKLKDSKNSFIPIVAGLAFGVSLSVLPFTVRIRKETVYEILPIFNGLLFLGLGIYLLIKRKSPEVVKNTKNILIRSAIILAVSSFFSYLPSSSTVYRTVLIAINNGNDYLVSNMQMFGYTEKFEAALENSDCIGAIEYAEKANNAGKRWLGITSEGQEKSLLMNTMIEAVQNDSTELPPELESLLKNFSGQNDLWKISGTYTNLFKAYKCQANMLYQKKDYEHALLYYQKADNALNSCDQNSKYWQLEQAYSMDALGMCYKSLNNYEFADSLFVGAIEKYLSIKDTLDRQVAYLFRNLAKSMSDQVQYANSNKFYETAIAILEMDTSQTEIKKDLVEAYHGLITNHFQADSLEKAMFWIEKSYLSVDKRSLDFCNTNLYSGVYYYKLSEYEHADSIFTICLECFKSQLKPTHQSIAETHLALAKVKLALATYQSAKSHADQGIEITSENYGTYSVRYANYLKVLAQINHELGNYELAESGYYHSMKLYITELGDGNRKLPEVLSDLSVLEVDLAKFGYAKPHSDSSLAFLTDFIDLDNPSATGLFNNAAYVNYSIGSYQEADSLYKKSIGINTKFGLSFTASTAIAQNGYALVLTAMKEYGLADSLFTEALALHKQIFTEHHPFTAVVYMNYGFLKIEQGKLKEAKEMLTKSLEINKKFFDSGHDIFADIFLGFGDLAKKEMFPVSSREYYQKALEIYINKFGEDHIKVTWTKSRLIN